MPRWQGDGGFGVAMVPAGKWHHLVGIVDGKMKFLYLDGNLAKEEGFDGPMQAGGTEHEIGNATDGGFVGIIDEVVIYNKALSANEVKQLFAAEGLPVQLQGKLAARWGDIKKVRQKYEVILLYGKTYNQWDSSVKQTVSLRTNMHNLTDYATMWQLMLYKEWKIKN